MNISEKEESVFTPLVNYNFTKDHILKIVENMEFWTYDNYLNKMVEFSDGEKSLIVEMNYNNIILKYYYMGFFILSFKFEKEELNNSEFITLLLDRISSLKAVGYIEWNKFISK